MPWSFDVMEYMVAVLVGIVGLAQMVLFARLAREIRMIGRVGDRLAQLTQAMALLTDTTEAGFANIASELEPSDRRRTRASSGTARRIRGAASQGETPARIAATEGLSENEVRLHLHLEDAGTRWENSNGQMHAR